MTLPATFEEAIEAQAVAEARAIIRSVRDERFTFAPGLTLSRFNKADSRRLRREFFKSLAAANAHRLRGVIDCAEAGWTVAREALLELAEEYEARDEKPPSRLRLYILDAAAADHPMFTHWGAPEEHWGKACYEFFQPRIYSVGAERLIHPIPGALEAIQALRKLGHEITYVTSCIGNTEETKHAWLLCYGFLESDSEFLPMHKKGKAPVDVLVDDGMHNCLAFGVERSLLVTRPHNVNSPWLSDRRISHVSELLDRLPNI